MTIIVLPTLDGSREAAVARLEAWDTVPLRRRLADKAKSHGRLGEMYDRLEQLDVAS